MSDELDRAQLVHLVEKIMNVEGNREEIEDWLRLVENHVPDPNVIGLIFWPTRCGLRDESSAEEIVEKALSYKSIQL